MPLEPPRGEHVPMTSSTLRKRPLALAFAPLDKRAMGLAFGMVLAVVLAVVTGLSLVIDPQQRLPLNLLSEYLVGYRVSLPGIVVGTAWMLFVGFIWGWFLAWCRNLVLAIWLVAAHVRADVEASRSFLDHI